MPSVVLSLTARADVSTFTSPASGVAVDGAVASWTGSDVGNLYYTTNALAALPVGCTIVGLTVTVRAGCTSLPDNEVHVYSGGASSTPLGILPYTTTTLSDYTFGSPTQVFAGASTRETLTTFRHRAWGSGMRSDTHTVDGVVMTVYYELSSVGAPILFLNEAF